MTSELVKAISLQEAENHWNINNIQYPLTTSDATPEIIATIELPDYTTGHLEIDIAAMVDDGSAKFTAKWIVGFHKDTVLTLDTETTLHAQNGIAGASFDVIVDSENAAVEVTGVGATNIVWLCMIKPFLLTITPSAP